jgi:hypothetical protein
MQERKIMVNKCGKPVALDSLGFLERILAVFGRRPVVFMDDIPDTPSFSNPPAEKVLGVKEARDLYSKLPQEIKDSGRSDIAIALSLAADLMGIPNVIAPQAAKEAQEAELKIVETQQELESTMRSLDFDIERLKEKIASKLSEKAEEKKVAEEIIDVTREDADLTASAAAFFSF